MTVFVLAISSAQYAYFLNRNELPRNTRKVTQVREAYQLRGLDRTKPLYVLNPGAGSYYFMRQLDEARAMGWQLKRIEDTHIFSEEELANV